MNNSTKDTPNSSPLPAESYPLGAHFDGQGVNFAVYSAKAEKIELCLFNSDEKNSESKRVPLTQGRNCIWHRYIPGIVPGQLYGFRAYGPFSPELGLRFNPNKLLIDPYAKEIGRDLRWHHSLFSFSKSDNGNNDDRVFDHQDSSPYAPLATVSASNFNWKNDSPPNIPWEKTIIYEAHVKGFTFRHPKVDPEIRGTYSALASPVVLEHLLSLGVTAIELLPVHHRVKDYHLAKKGLDNYWGYNTLAFFSPDLRFSTETGAGAVNEFKAMVQSLHQVGIEVILDVVFNHTADGSELGPTLSWKGLDNTSYYRLVKDNPRYYENYSGCGNTLDTRNPALLRMIMDSLRYWIEEMHVDGFRFDLASALARRSDDFDPSSSFLDIIYQDPTISKVKLIAEPWDVGLGGYQLGAFPPPWAEWNDQYRTTIRRFWRGDKGLQGQFATRLAGSSDLFWQAGRSPSSSINYVTCHDGFTLHDLVSYENKHNLANGENNLDGDNNHCSVNCGVEGITENKKILALRNQQRRNLLTTLMLSAGVPMILGGDELGRTQKGNNNPYCQDNEINWFNWELTADDLTFLSFVKQLFKFRKSSSCFNRKSFFKGEKESITGLKDLSWIHPLGQEMKDTDWQDQNLSALGMLLSNTVEGASQHNESCILILFNSSANNVTFILPRLWKSCRWELAFDTASAQDFKSVTYYPSQDRAYNIKAKSITAFIVYEQRNI